MAVVSWPPVRGRSGWGRALAAAFVVQALVADAVVAGAWARHVSVPAPAATPDDQAVRSTQLDGAVVFIGDSRVAMLATSSVADRAENFGIDGDNTRTLSAKLGSLDLSKARAVVLAIGVNDWWPDRFAGFADRYAAILARLPAGTPVVAAAILPVDEARVWRAYDGRIDFRGVDASIPPANRQIEALCRTRPGCVFAPAPAALADPGGLPARYSLDGAHLNAAGAAIWSAALRSALVTATPPPTR